MQARDDRFVVERAVSADVPDCRSYRSAEAALLDESLCQAIESAAALDSEFVVQTLSAQLEKHYGE